MIYQGWYTELKMTYIAALTTTNADQVCSAFSAFRLRFAAANTAKFFSVATATSQNLTAFSHRNFKAETSDNDSKLGQDKVRASKRAFFAGLFDLTWRMIAAMLAPILIGAYIDNRYRTGQTFTIIGVLLSLAGAALVIRSIVRKFSDMGGNS